MKKAESSSDSSFSSDSSSSSSSSSEDEKTQGEGKTKKEKKLFSAKQRDEKARLAKVIFVFNFILLLKGVTGNVR